MRLNRILLTLFLLITLAACQPQTAPVLSVEPQLPEVIQVEQTAEPGISPSNKAVNLAEEYGLAESSRVIFSELNLSSEEEPFSYLTEAVLEDSAGISSLVNSLNQALESMPAARCPAEGRLSFYANGDLISEFGLGCELENIFFLSDLQNGEHYRLSAELQGMFYEFLVLSGDE